MKKIIEFEGVSVARTVRYAAAGRLVKVTMRDGVPVHVKRKRLIEPVEIRGEVQPYLFEQDSIAQFIEEMCELPDPSDNSISSQFVYKANNTDVYDAYKKFCSENGDQPRTHRRLTQNLKERGFKNQPENGKRVWHGFSLRT